MNKMHEVSDVHFDYNLLVITIDKEVRKFPIDQISSKLKNATDNERNTYEISPSGYGIHWPILDEDLSIDGLLHYAKRNKSSAEVDNVK